MTSSPILSPYALFLLPFQVRPNLDPPHRHHVLLAPLPNLPIRRPRHRRNIIIPTLRTFFTARPTTTGIDTPIAAYRIDAGAGFAVTAVGKAVGAA